MYANIINKTIEMSKSEAKAAGKVNSEEFKELQQLRNAYSNFELVVKNPPKRKTVTKDLTFDYMRAYIEKHGGERKDALLEEFEKLVPKFNKDNEDYKDIFVSTSYVEVKDWFFTSFPEFAAYQKDVKAILEKVKENKNKKVA